MAEVKGDGIFGQILKVLAVLFSVSGALVALYSFQRSRALSVAELEHEETGS